MTRLVIVPNYLRDELYRRIDDAIESCPEAAPDREVLYSQLLEAYDELGEIPSFSLARRDPSLTQTEA